MHHRFQPAGAQRLVTRPAVNWYYVPSHAYACTCMCTWRKQNTEMHAGIAKLTDLNINDIAFYDFCCVRCAYLGADRTPLGECDVRKKRKEKNIRSSRSVSPAFTQRKERTSLGKVPKTWLYTTRYSYWAFEKTGWEKMDTSHTCLA